MNGSNSTTVLNMRNFLMKLLAKFARKLTSLLQPTSHKSSTKNLETSSLDKDQDTSDFYKTIRSFCENQDAIVILGNNDDLLLLSVLLSKPKLLTIIDPQPLSNLQMLKEFASDNGINLEFIQENTVVTSKVGNCNILIFNSENNYKQRSIEIYRNCIKCSRFMLFPCTIKAAYNDETDLAVNNLPPLTQDFLIQLKPAKGIVAAINQFLIDDMFMYGKPHWRIREGHAIGNGLTVLERTLS